MINFICRKRRPFHNYNSYEVPLRKISKGEIDCQPAWYRLTKWDFVSSGGFTLIELILYFAIFGIVALLGVTTFSFALRGKTAVVGRLTEVHQNSQRALQQIVNRVHLSTGIGAVTTTTLNLSMASSTLNPTIFSFASNALSIKEGTAATTTLTPSTILITDVVFTKVTNPDPSTSSVRISLTAAYNESGQAASGTSYTLQTAAMPLQ